MNPQEIRDSFRDLLVALLADHGKDGGLGKEARVRALSIAKDLRAAFEEAEKVRDTIEVDDPRFKRGFDAALEQVVKWHESEFERLEDASKGHADRNTKLVIATKLTTHKASADFIRGLGKSENTYTESMVP